MCALYAGSVTINAVVATERSSGYPAVSSARLRSFAPTQQKRREACNGAVGVAGIASPDAPHKALRLGPIRLVLSAKRLEHHLLLGADAEGKEDRDRYEV